MNDKRLPNKKQKHVFGSADSAEIETGLTLRYYTEL